MFGCKACREKDRLIASLESERDWLRYQVGGLVPTQVTQAAPELPDLKLQMDLPSHVTEDEAEILWLKDNDFLSAADADEALRKLRAEHEATTEIEA